MTDPRGPRRTALTGRVVTMDEQSTAYARGAVYIEGARIVAVQAADAPAPPGFDGAKQISAGGTIYPGMVELHNHIAYNALPLWKVPRRYEARDQWGREDEYARLVTGPMHVIGASDAMPAVARYVEMKCLVAGVTTTQGITLANAMGSRRFFKGLIRNVEQTDDPTLPTAATRIADVDAQSWTAFRDQLRGNKQLLLHLAEGQGDRAREHFLALEHAGEWAITPRLVGIHCAALDKSDFEVLAAHGGGMVWSPLSNLLLYGGTAEIEAARSAGVLMALGSDWSPTGSKNLLCELKVARRVASPAFGDRDVFAMATRNAARLAAWEGQVGSLEAGHRADLFVLTGTSADPYAQVIAATEADVRLVMIDGVPRFGLSDLMRDLGANGERVAIDRSQRTLDLADPAADPLVAGLSFADATSQLAKALDRLPQLAAEQEEAAKHPEARAAAAARWRLALDETEPTGFEVRPRLAMTGGGAGPEVVSPLALKVPLSKLLGPIGLDPLTLVGDDRELDLLQSEASLPAGLGAAVAGYY